jgi:hypothetical protein
MKKFVITLFTFIVYLSFSCAGEVNGKFEITQNDGINGGMFKIAVEINLTSSPVVPEGQLGQSTVFVNFNNSDLSIPSGASVGNSLVNGTDYSIGSQIVANGNYQYDIKLAAPNIINIGLVISQNDPGIDIQVAPNWTTVIIFNFTITNASSATNFTWSTIELFDDGNSTQYANGTFTNETGTPLPVELTNFTAANTDADVNLNWETATEVDNYGFEIERALNTDDKVWENIGFVTGYGNSNSPKEYSYVDHSPIGGNKFVYRLKQIDNDGTFTYSDAVEVEVIPNRYELYQNYPNPFNPSTTIRFSLKETQDVKIVIYDQLGQEVNTIVNQKYDAGYHEFEFNASGIASGVYFYRIIAGHFVNVKKMMLLK